MKKRREIEIDRKVWKTGENGRGLEDEENCPFEAARVCPGTYSISETSKSGKFTIRNSFEIL